MFPRRTSCILLNVVIGRGFGCLDDVSARPYRRRLDSGKEARLLKQSDGEAYAELRQVRNNESPHSYAPGTAAAGV